MTKLAIVHERFTEFAGSEAVVAQLADVWPNATIHAPIGDPAVVPQHLHSRLHVSGLSALLRGSTYAHLLPALPFAMRTLRIPDVDVVLASHHAFANQIAFSTKAPVISYVHSPARWVWEPSLREGEVGGPIGRVLLAAFASAYKPMDLAAAARVHTFVANSTAVAERIDRWWNREAVVVHPPVDVDRYTPDPAVAREPFFLVAGRLVSYKRPDLAIRAAKRAGAKLVVAGDGRARQQLEAMAGPETTFLGRVSDDDLLDLYRRCTALLMPGVEDFGIVPVEAQACGTPVIAIDEGGTRDSVIPGISGVLVPALGATDDSVQAWAEALANFDNSKFDAQKVRANAERFSRANFQSAMRRIVSELDRATGSGGPEPITDEPLPPQNLGERP